MSVTFLTNEDRKEMEERSILTTPQELTDEQRAQARANIAKVQYDWREVTCPFSGTQRLADYQATFGSSSFDIDKAIALPSAVLSTHSAIGCLHTSVDMLCNTVNLDEKTVLNSMGEIVTDYELMKSEGVLTSSNRLYVCRKNQYTDEVYEYYLLQPNSNGYTHYLIFTCYKPYRATVIFYNKDTGAYKVSRSANNYTDSTLTLEYSPADAKATGDAIAAAKTTAETALSGLVGKITAPQTAEVGQTIVVKSVDDDGAPKEWGAYTIPQADFSQNDETAADYMKNRTHWTEREKVILPETSLTYDGDVYAIYSENSIGLVAGNSYTVIYDGEEYTCIGVDLTSFMGTACVGLGNLAEFGIESAEYPFIVLDAPGGIEDGFCTAVMGSGEATVSIVYEGETVHKLDNKYLNLDWLPITEEKGDILPETVVSINTLITGTSNYYLNIDTVISYTAGQKVVVYVNGTRYVCEILEDDGIGYIHAGALTMQCWRKYTSVVSSAPGEYTLRICELEANCLPEEYLPAGVPLIQTAEVGQVISVKAVDDEGKPNEFECVSQKNGNWRLIRVLELDEECTRVDITLDDNGVPFSCSSMWVKVDGYSATEESTRCIMLTNGNWDAKDPYITLLGDMLPTTAGYTNSSYANINAVSNGVYGIAIVTQPIYEYKSTLPHNRSGIGTSAEAYVDIHSISFVCSSGFDVGSRFTLFGIDKM